MAADRSAQVPPDPDEPTLAFGRAPLPPRGPISDATYPATAVPYQRPPRSAAVPILTVLVLILVLALFGLMTYSMTAVDRVNQKQEQTAAQLAEEQRRVKELQAQVAAAKAEAEKAKRQQSGAEGGAVEQLTSCTDALAGVMKARSAAEFGKAFETMQQACKIAGIPLF
ncbi:MAG: hypothetical protein HOV79_31600 [Hamadaea sp.]|nr:hypothetical protein [Hamadaea sp.]